MVMKDEPERRSRSHLARSTFREHLQRREEREGQGSTKVNRTGLVCIFTLETKCGSFKPTFKPKWVWFNPVLLQNKKGFGPSLPPSFEPNGFGFNPPCTPKSVHTQLGRKKETRTEKGEQNSRVTSVRPIPDSEHNCARATEQAGPYPRSRRAPTQVGPTSPSQKTESLLPGIDLG